MAAQALYRGGTLAFCPTVISSSLEVYHQALPALAEAIRNQPQPGAGQGSLLAGIHLEGPFISPEEGAVGAHPRQHVRAPSVTLFDELYALAGGQIALLTLAPELPGALELIRHACGRGVTVSIGHTLADAAAIRAAVAAGASLSTHLGNGCPNFIHRHHNPLWPQLAAPGLSAMLITDGHHLPAEFIATALAAKGSGRVIITSELIPGCRLPARRIYFLRHTCPPGTFRAPAQPGERQPGWQLGHPAGLYERPGRSRPAR